MLTGAFTVSGHIADPLSRRFYNGILTIRDGRIAEITECPDALPEDAPWILPGFVDAHVHIESSMLLPETFARTAVRHGTVAIVTDPHEIANVLGIAGVDFMIRNSRRLPFHFLFGAPSCVPSTDQETSGARLDAAAIRTLMQRDDIGFLAEMMNVPGVLSRDPDTLDKLAAAREAGKSVDGHAPALEGEELARYVAAGIATDHECANLDEARARIALGMKILIRQGSAARDFNALCPLLVEAPESVMFCTDDLHPDRLARAHINRLVHRALEEGYPLWNILQAASVNPVRHYHLPVGLLQLGDSADFILVDKPRAGLEILKTYVSGYCYDCEREPQYSDHQGIDWPNHFCASRISADALRVAPLSDRLRVMTCVDGTLRTGEALMEPKIEDGNVVADPARDILKIVVLNRYVPRHPAVGFIQGFGMKRGAIAATVSHDSHNIIALGTSDAEIASAINCLVDIKGGLCVSDGGSCTALPLPVAGLISPLPIRDVNEIYGILRDKARNFGCTFHDAFMTLSFMALPVIPRLKMTDLGLFDVEAFRHISCFA